MSDLAEKTVIGCLLMDNKELHQIYDLLKPDMFQDPVLKEIYREIVKLYDIGQPANLVTVTQIVYRFDGNEMRFQETEEELKSKDGFKTVRTPTPFD